MHLEETFVEHFQEGGFKAHLLKNPLAQLCELTEEFEYLVNRLSNLVRKHEDDHGAMQIDNILVFHPDPGGHKFFSLETDYFKVSGQ